MIELRSVAGWDWIDFHVLAGIVFLAGIRVVYGNQFRDALRSLINGRIFSAEVYDQQALSGFHTAIALFQLTNLALFLHLLQPWRYLGWQADWSYFPILGGLFVLVGGRLLLDRLVGSVFRDDFLVDWFYSHRFVAMFLLAIVLQGANMYWAFAAPEDALTAAVWSAVMGILLVFALVLPYLQMGQRVIKLGFYFMIYICTLEIAPLILLYNWLVAGV